MLLLWMFPLLLISQSVRPYTPVKMVDTDTFEYTYLTYNLTSIVTIPNHSSYHAIIDLGGGMKKLVYSPEQGFVGRDTILVEYYPKLNGSQEYLGFSFLVGPSVVNAVTDYIVTDFNTAVTIPVLGNDFTSSGSLSIGDIFIQRYGTAAIVNDEIQFTPSNDFSGIAQIGYTSCNDDDICDQGIVNVFVLPENGLSLDDTFEIQITKNASIDLMVQLDGYDQVDVSPAHGSVEDHVHDVIRYIPDNNYFGSDLFTVSGDKNGETYTRTFDITIIDQLVDRRFAMNDVFHTHLNTSFTFNVLDNDVGAYTVIYPQYIQVSHGTLVYLGNGDFTYTPPVNFKGTAKFSYYTGSPAYNIIVETGHVDIIVDDFKPKQPTYSFHTLAEKPLVIHYTPPAEPWSFTMKADPLHGGAVIYDGEQTITLENQDITGYNMIVYTPDAGFYGDIDEFEVEYCVNGNCQSVKFQIDVLENLNPAEDQCIETCVWPGDANNDGIVNIRDLLSIGYAMGTYGPERVNGNSDWQPQFGDDWEDPYTDALLDLKHLDTNGDGIVSAQDTAAIAESYLNTHKITTIKSHQLNTDIDLRFLVRDTSQYSGDTLIILDILLGLSNKPAYDAYGLSFEIDFADIINLEDKDPRVVYYENSWLSHQKPTLEMFKRLGPTTIHSGYTKVDGEKAVGYGPIGFVIVDDFEGVRLPALRNSGKSSYNIVVRNITLMNSNGEFSYYPDQTITIENRDNLANDNSEASLAVISPNPTASDASIYLRDNQIMETVQVFNLTGSLVYDSGRISTSSWALNTTSLSNGMYILRIKTEDAIFTEKLEVVR